MDRYYAALIQYGEALVNQKAWCEAQTQYELALAIRPDPAVQEALQNIILQCQGATETPLVTETPTTTATIEAITPTPGLDTPTPTATQPATIPSATATQSQPTTPPSETPTLPAPVETPTPTNTTAPQQPNSTPTQPNDGGNLNPTTGLLEMIAVLGFAILAWKPWEFKL